MERMNDMDISVWLVVFIVLIVLAASGWIYALCGDLPLVQCKTLNRKMNNVLCSNKKSDNDFKENTISSTSNNVKSLSAESEVAFIQKLLEKKFNKKFQTRVRVEGYLGENDMKYTLVMDDYCTDDPHHEYHSIYGNSTENILDVRHAFLKAYWQNVEKGINSVGQELDEWDAKMVESYRNTIVAKSREELLIRAELEGIIA